MSNDCIEPLLFLKRPNNRAGLSHIDYRIGTYSDFRKSLFRALDKDPLLATWTYRKADDPGIALLEGASILGDILTFYQELYANEAYLRTAQWRESITDLVRLLGYKLSPGLGGKGTFAFEIRGDKPVVIPAGFPLKAQLEGIKEQVEFESVTEVKAFPHLSRFHLYRRRKEPQTISSGRGRNSLEIQSIGNSSHLTSIAAHHIKPGDRIILVPDAHMFDITGIPYSTQRKSEILIVSEVKQVLDRTILFFEGALTENRGLQVTAYRIGRSFRHFGHNAPQQITTFSNRTRRVTQSNTNFTRNIYGTHSLSNNYSGILVDEMPLDQEVDDLALGGKLICEGMTQFDGISSPVPFVVVKDIQNLRSDTLKWGHLNASSTVVKVSSKLIANDSILNESSDIRQIRFHEVIGQMLTLRAPTTWNNRFFIEKGLNFYGTYREALSLSGRKLLLEGKDRTLQQLNVITEPSSFSLWGKDEVHRWMWPITVSATPNPFLQEDFDEQIPSVTVFGNLVEATQGKSEREAVLGNGDSRQTFQTFRLPKAPLTYHNAVGETPPESPELKIYVNNRLWKRLPSFFNRKPDEAIYIVREDADNNSWVQFGDGKTGTRLPSGIKNVVAKYRTGTGAYGALKEETTVQAGGRVDHLHKIRLPGVISGGQGPESDENAREAAPGKIQSLDRLVSLKDFESETLAISGVSEALAAWDLIDNVPGIVITVLMETGRNREIDEVRRIMASYNRCRGPQRFSIKVVLGKLKYVYLDVVYGINPTFRNEIVGKAIKETLGVNGDEGKGIDGTKGLFGLRNRTFGQQEYATRIAGTIQNVDGVVWAKVRALGMLGGADDPAALTLPAEPKPLSKVIYCGSLHVLSLYANHLQIRVADSGSKGEC